MPAKNLHRISEEGTYSHVYNRGVEKRAIFNDKEDYQVFLGYLKEYLTPIADAESVKKKFTVKGREYRGTPHQPKNYFNKVELITYSLMPTHFSLVLQQKTKDSLQSFIRSLCTRYSMYFNKKYHRTGSLFAGPYKSAHIKEASQLVYLANYLHKNEEYSSSLEYLGKRETAWVKPDVVLSQTSVVPKIKEEEEKELLRNIIFETNDSPAPKPAASPVINDKHTHLPVFARLPEIVAITIVFLLLLSLGMKNILASSDGSVASTVSSPIPSSTPIPTPMPKIERKVAVKITDGAFTVNIRQSASVLSEKVGEAKNGDIFELLSIVEERWYEVKLANGSSGFIISTYMENITN